MKSSRAAGISIVLALLAPAQARPAAARATCDSLASLRLPNATVTSAAEVAAGAFTPPTAPGRGVAPALAKTMAGLQAFCRVQITSTPTADSDIKIEVWLPGAAALTESCKPSAMADGPGLFHIPRWPRRWHTPTPTVGTDSGHTTPGASFAVGHPEKLVDYAHRSLHEMAVNAKVLVDAYYGKPAAASIWNGCSTGGNQGLTLASMYPNDFDAIVAGAPPDIRSRVHAVRLVLHRFVHRTAGSYIPPEKYPAVHKAVMDACDLKDGVKDGIIENPPACRFDPKVLQCTDADGPSCLTAEQVETARALYSDIKHPKTGQVLYSPLLQPGSELLWGTLAGPQPFSNASETYKYLVAQDQAWDPGAIRCRDRRGEDGHGRGSAEHGGRQPEAVLRARRQTSAVSRLERSAESGIDERQLLQARREDRRPERCRQVHPALHGSGHEPLPGRRRHRHVRQGGGHRGVDAEGHRAGADRRVACDRRQGRSHAPVVPVSAGCRV